MAANLEALIEKEGADTIAAMIAEPVMGAGGVILPPKGYFEAIGRVLAKHDIPLIDDEVICGFGRTGAMFGCETYRIPARDDDGGEGAVERVSADLRGDDLAGDERASSSRKAARSAPSATATLIPAIRLPRRWR